MVHISLIEVGISILRILVIFITVGFLCIIGLGIYYFFFHPLAKYPGPFFARFTNLYSAYHAWIGDIHMDICRCHEKYGDTVRYAPNRLVYWNTEAMSGNLNKKLLVNWLPADGQDIYNHRSNVQKSRVYSTLVHRAPNTLTLIDKVEHGKRRRIISQGFSDAALRTYQPKILAQVQNFCSALTTADKYEGAESMEKSTLWTKPQNMARWLDYLTFDMMANIIFSAAYNTIDSEDYRYVVQAIEESNVRMSVILQAKELTFGKIDKYLFPTSIIARNKFVRFVGNMMQERLKREDLGGTDVFSLLRNAKDPDSGRQLSVAELGAESATMIVAGSDTTSTTMAGTLFYVSRHPTVYEKVTKEIRECFTSIDEIQLEAKLNSCTYLRACIDETLRMSPAAGSSLWREVQKGGITLNGAYVPEGCDVGVGVYSIQHNPKYWPEPSRFNPDRWLKTKSGAIKATDGKSAYMPFSIGSRSCIGKGLAIAEAMLALATFIWKFDFKDAEFEGEHTLDRNPGEFELHDHVTGAKNGPILRLRLRE